MTDKDIFDMADSYADWDDFGRWMFSDSDNLLNFVAAIQEAEREAILEAVEALTGMEADRHKMFSEGYDHALYHIRQVVEGRSKI